MWVFSIGSIIGIYNLDPFQAVTTQLSNMRSEAFSRQVSTIEDVPNLRIGPSAAAWVCLNTWAWLVH